MKTLILIFHLLVCIFEIWMLSDFYDAFLGYKNKGKKRNLIRQMISIWNYYIIQIIT